MSREPPCAGFQLHPQGAFVRGNHLEARGLADYRQVGAQAAGNQGARAGLTLLFVNQGSEDDFRIRRPLPALRQFA